MRTRTPRRATALGLLSLLLVGSISIATPTPAQAATTSATYFHICDAIPWFPTCSYDF